MSFFVYYKRERLKGFKFTSKYANYLVENHSVIQLVKVIQSFEGKHLNSTLKRYCKSHLPEFTHLRYGNGTALVFLNRKDKIAIKINGTTAIADEATPTKAIPTAYRLVKDSTKTKWENIHTVRIQPLAEKSRILDSEAMSILAPLEHNEIGYDLHVGNVGFHNGKAVVIDW